MLWWTLWKASRLSNRTDAALVHKLSVYGSTRSAAALAKIAASAAVKQAVRLSALTALERVDATTATPALLEIIRSSDEPEALRRAAVRSLGRLREPTAAAALVGAWLNPAISNSIKHEALAALCDAGESARDSLRAQLVAPSVTPTVRARCYEGLKVTSWRPASERERAWAAVFERMPLDGLDVTEEMQRYLVAELSDCPPAETVDVGIQILVTWPGRAAQDSVSQALDARLSNARYRTGTECVSYWPLVTLLWDVGSDQAALHTRKWLQGAMNVLETSAVGPQRAPVDSALQFATEDAIARLVSSGCDVLEELITGQYPPRAAGRILANTCGPPP
jgi:hypothetical protein